jgi:hypothetical protein
MSEAITRPIVIGREECQRVVIEILGDGPGASQIAQVTVSCGVWHGTFACEFHEGRLRRFADELDGLQWNRVGPATLEAALGAFELKMTGDGQGQILVEGLAKPGRYTGTQLAFTIRLDRTELPAIIAGLRAS